MDPFYPKIAPGSGWQIETILKNAAQDPYYLEDSPYEGEDLLALQRMSASDITLAVAEEEPIFEGNKWDRLERESNNLYAELVGFKDNLDERDNAERMSYFRTATSLLEKIVGIQERAANLKKINQFHDAVLSAMEDLLEGEQRTAVLNRLQAAINPEA